MRRFVRSAFFLVDRTFCTLTESASFQRLLDRLSHHEEPDPANGAGRPPARIPDLGYRATPYAGIAVPMAAPRHLQAWEVQWKPAGRSAPQDLGYQCRGGFYLPQGGDAGRRPGLLILPVLHDRFSLASGTLARYFACRGFAALELRSGPSFLDRVRVTPHGSGPTWEEVMAEMILDGRRGLDWLCTRPEVDGRRLGIVGVSHGAIVGPCVLGADRRLTAGVFCMGGADHAMIVARSREPSVRRFRKRLLRVHGLSHAEELSRLAPEEKSPTDPLRYAPAVDPRAVLLFKTGRDRAVVPEAQDRLWEALGRPRRITLPFGHIGFGLAFYYAARHAAEFLRQRLSTSP